MQEYETIIGLEVHIELSSATKIFCGCSASYGGRPNSHTCPVCLGMPGTLPVLNKAVVEKALAVCLALECRIQTECRFDRKNYFYPDNPQNYQITQRYLPIGEDGFLEIETPDGGKRIGITEIHMEEDAGKLVHMEGNRETLIDYNRAGVPLIEIVTQPDFREADEVISFLEKLRHVITYLGAGDCKLQEGSMRVDVNLSVHHAGELLGTRTEMKNLNSFRSVVAAIASERKRQMDLLDSGGEVILETRRWDDGCMNSFTMRSKEVAEDYRYFPEPDLPPLKITGQQIEQARNSLPEFREERRDRLIRQYGLSREDADLITDSRILAELFEKTVSFGVSPKQVSNWLIGETMRILREKEMDPGELAFSAEHFASLISLCAEKRITNAVAKNVYEKMCIRDFDPNRYVEKNGLEMMTDLTDLTETVKNMIARNPQSVADYRAGKDKVIGFLVGQTMKATGGKADPNLAAQLLRSLLSET